jgi:cytochrome c oxidase cbb3-type subunit 4
MSPEMLATTGIVRGIVAAVLLVAFTALWAWAYSGRRRAMFDALSQMPLEDDDYHTVPSRGKVQ